jgi:hypothetical protein
MHGGRHLKGSTDAARSGVAMKYVAGGGVDLVHLHGDFAAWKKFLHHGTLAPLSRCGWSEELILARKTKRTQHPQKCWPF